MKETGKVIYIACRDDIISYCAFYLLEYLKYMYKDTKLAAIYHSLAN